MRSICKDATLKICSFLSDQEKVYFAMIATSFSMLLSEMIYSKKVRFDAIEKLPYFDNFECVQLLHFTNKCPKFAKYVYYEASTRDIPQNVTHLTFTQGFNKSIKGIIPKSVTDLEFSWDFIQSVQDCIPSTVKNMTFSYYFGRDIIKEDNLADFNNVIGLNHDDHGFDRIPYTIMHVTYCRYYNKSAKLSNLLPQTWCATDDRDPDLKKCLTLSHNYDKFIEDDRKTIVKVLIDSPNN